MSTPIQNKKLESAIERALTNGTGGSEFEDGALVARVLTRWWGDAAINVARHVVKLLEDAGT